MEEDLREFEITEVPKQKTKLGYCHFLGEVTGPPTATANWKGISTFQVASMQPQHATLAPPQLQRLFHSIKQTPPLAVQANRCASEVFLSRPNFEEGILQPAVLVIGCACEGLRSHVSTS